MTVVVDASAAVRWIFRLSGWQRAEAIILSGERLIAPDFVLVEMTNAAWKFVRFENQPAETVHSALRNAAKAFDEFVPAADLADRAFEIAVLLQHAAYDCFYLALAESRRSQVITTDEKLIRRCTDTPFAALLRPL
jgi:predicted nucleic acid-binding protein